jgi:NAD+ kinase
MLSNRPLVLPDDCVVRVALKSASESVYLTVDGQVGLKLQQGDVIEVRRSTFTAKVLAPCGHDYFNLLRTKLKWGER